MKNEGVAPPSWRSSFFILQSSLFIFLLALAPRLAALDAYVTIDESRWLQRASDFYALLAQRDPEDTFIIGHPGVTTMWTALLGMGTERALHFSFREGRTDATRREGYFDALVAARRPFALLGAAGVAVVSLLGWRLLGAGPALVGGTLLALEPFLVAHAQVVHLDSGLTVYTSVCLLAALIYWSPGGGVGYVLVSGAAAGLAFLTKAPSVFVVGFVPLFAAFGLIRSGDRRGWSWLRLVLLLAVWGAIAVVVCLALWPALRANPLGTLIKMAQFTARVGGGEHDNFFFGHAREDPGPFFYPLALLLRLSPLTLVGLTLALGSWRWLNADQRYLVAVFGAYCLGFVLMMSTAPKKFDRYLLPLFPVLGLVAGLGLWTVYQRVLGDLTRRSALVPEPPSLEERRRSSTGSPFPSGKGAGGLGLATAFALTLVALQATPLLAVYPYSLAFYNPLLGGGAAAQRAILVGWGEGLDQVAGYLNSQPRPLGEPTVATSYHRVLQAQLAGSALPLERLRMADYVVPYVNTLQRGAERQDLGPYLDDGPPELAIWINDIEYARVYRGPHYPHAETLGADFGGRVTLLSYVAAPGSGVVQPGDEMQVQLRWDRPPSGDERAAVALVGFDGRQIIQDERQVGADGPDEAGQPGEIHRLTIPSGTPPAEYRLAVRVTDPRARVTLQFAAGPRAGSDTLALRTIVVRAGP
ncbi:MAG TPA: hypothetical protein VEQ11_00435 [Chloroflexota bacterium]|nr:hypothetical protein [Chloroflexota bacterium]